MAKTSTPALTQNGLLGQVQLTTANTNRDGTTGAYSAAVNAGANDSFIDYIAFQAITTTVAGLLRIFVTDGTAYRMIAEIVTSAVTVSGTVGGDNHIWIPPGGVPLQFPTGYSVKFNVNNASETWNVFVAGESY